MIFVINIEISDTAAEKSLKKDVVRPLQQRRA